MTGRERISTNEAPGAIGPYSQALRIGESIYCSGQIPLDPATGVLVGDDVATQTRQVLKNLEAVLRAAGSSLKDAVKCQVFLADEGDFAKNFAAMNAVYVEAFGDPPPARSCIAAARLPKGALVEIDVVAVRSR